MIQEPTYSIPDRSADWPMRIEAACKIVETGCEVQLTKAHAYQADQPPIELKDRLVYLKKKSKTRTKWISIYADAKAYSKAAADGMRYVFSVGGCSYANREIYNCTVQIPGLDAEGHEQMLVQIGDALGAYSAQWLPIETAKRLYRVQSCFDFGSGPKKDEVTDLTDEERQLPMLFYTIYNGLESPLQPYWLGWLNYWSSEVCDYLGFPDAERDGGLLEYSYKTPAGAWLVKLGAEPLDTKNPLHMKLLARAYSRFDRAGKRVTQPVHQIQKTDP